MLSLNIGSQFFGTSGAAAGVFGGSDLTGISKLVSLFLQGAFVLAGVILLFYFILGGIGMIGSAGKNDPKSLEQAKQTITTAIIGFIVVFTAYWIVKLIGTLIGQPNII